LRLASASEPITWVFELSLASASEPITWITWIFLVQQQQFCVQFSILLVCFLGSALAKQWYTWLLASAVGLHRIFPL
jgi:hypothetical protein